MCTQHMHMHRHIHPHTHTLTNTCVQVQQISPYHPLLPSVLMQKLKGAFAFSDVSVPCVPAVWLSQHTILTGFCVDRTKYVVTSSLLMMVLLIIAISQMMNWVTVCVCVFSPPRHKERYLFVSFRIRSKFVQLIIIFCFVRFLDRIFFSFSVSVPQQQVSVFFSFHAQDSTCTHENRRGIGVF